MISFHFLVFYLILGFPIQEVPDIKLYEVERHDFIEIWAKNDNVYPVTINLDMEKRNLLPNKDLPLVEVLEPRSDRIVLILTIDHHGRRWEYSSNFTYFIGVVNAEHDDSYSYRLPYQIGTNQTVSQGYNGAFSHHGDARFSIDFSLPEGTAVYSARGGIVVKVEQGNETGGATPDFQGYANTVTILHNDGTFADYSHLKKNGARVQIGQQVREGQLIGYSGSTGYVTGPHLHFGVKKVLIDGSYITIPVKFATREGTVQLQERRSYTAY